jgi:hypothetical protein
MKNIVKNPQLLLALSWPLALIVIFRCVAHVSLVCVCVCQELNFGRCTAMFFIFSASSLHQLRSTLSLCKHQ